MTSPLKTAGALAGLALLSGCQVPSPAPVMTGRLSSRMTIAQVTDRVQSEAKLRSYALTSTSQWTFSLGLDKGRRIWTVYATAPDGSPNSWFRVDDDSGAVDFIMPMLQVSASASVADDRLTRVAKALEEIVYPLPLDDFLKQAQLAGSAAQSGGRLSETIWFLEYTLRHEKDSPERFEVRCYYMLPHGEFAEKLVVRAELAYWDEQLYRYRLVRDRDP
ncbi:MAG: hypothetical protein KF715_03900 [Candidatus Didemnitutus sp.]|nr:hypothetical protein [Candidatus Didemnitutus sp.]